ncbi:MAG: glycosyltransferase [Bacilli bacterium]
MKNKLLYIFYRIWIFIIPKNKLEENSNKIIVSVTSIPSRFSKLYLSLETIFHQTLKPSKIVLYLGNNIDKTKIPKQIIKMQKRGLEIKFREDVNLKPHTKYFYAMQEYQDNIIITFDDDIFYNKNVIKILYSSYLKFPNAISCMRPHKITFEGNKIKSYLQWEGAYNGEDALIPNHYLCATGVGGVLYPPNIMPPETFNIDLISKIALCQDDLWLKFIEVKHDIKIVKACHRNYKNHSINGTQEIALSQLNVEENRNDKYLTLLNEYFKLTKDDFDK